MHLDKHNSHDGYSFRLYFFTVQRFFFPRHAFLQTAAAPVLASWFYQSFFFFSFSCIYAWRYMHHGFRLAALV